MDALQAKVLLDRYLAGHATPEEIKLVETMYDRLLQEREWQWKEGEKEALQAILEVRLLQKIDDQTAPIRSIPRFSKYIRRLTAAAILIGISFGTYLLVQHRPAAVPTVATLPVKADVAAPTVAKATIKLAGGETIILDTAANGTLATQGNTRVVKTADGQITYNAGQQKITNELLYNTLNNPRGSRVVSITLTDGTKVWLNAASSLRYPSTFMGNEREVEITGEAYFEVTHNAAMPFKVKKGGMEVTVLGTHFNVNAYEDEAAIKVTLLEGLVKVAADGNSGVLKPGEQATINEKLKITGNVNLDQVMAWRNGAFSFTDVDLRTIMKQLARWYDVDVVYEGDPPTGLFEGEIGRTLSLDQVLKILTRTRVHYRIEGGNKIIILP